MISIVIPVLNEALCITELLNYLLVSVYNKEQIEFLVVDGGSSDNTVQIVSDLAASKKNIILLKSQRGRAKQMNYGAKHAKGDVLYFLHADSFPPKHFDKYILECVRDGHYAGCFRMQFTSTHWWLRVASWLTQFNFKACRGGDQSQFITKTLFENIGGFDENYIIYEDNILISELYKRNQFVVINKKLMTSARLYENHGIWYTQFIFFNIYLKKFLGATPERLYQYYKKHFHN